MYSSTGQVAARLSLYDNIIISKRTKKPQTSNPHVITLILITLLFIMHKHTLTYTLPLRVERHGGMTFDVSPFPCVYTFQFIYTFHVSSIHNHKCYHHVHLMACPLR